MGDVQLNEIYDLLQDEDSKIIYKSRVLYSVTRDAKELLPAIVACKRNVLERVNIDFYIKCIQKQNRNALGMKWILYEAGNYAELWKMILYDKRINCEILGMTQTILNKKNNTPGGGYLLLMILLQSINQILFTF